MTLPVYLPVYASLFRLLSCSEMGERMGKIPTTRGLKVPCSTTELLAQALPKVYSITAPSSTCQRMEEGSSTLPPSALVSISASQLFVR